jgi:hypothetical protein
MIGEYDPDEHGDYLDLKDCAKRMGLTVAQVTSLVRCGALRSIPVGFGEPPLVQPAILNVTP